MNTERKSLPSCGVRGLKRSFPMSQSKRDSQSKMTEIQQLFNETRIYILHHLLMKMEDKRIRHQGSIFSPMLRGKALSWTF